MYNLPYFFYDINIFSISLRLILALILGGIIGLERGANRHPAGFRTHILVCVGAALAMMTNQFIVDNFGASDPARLGAQVITGVGFLGVGTILITGHSRIKGLTTAAGLWASACLGLAIGIGFYSGAIAAAIIIFVSLTLLPKIENHFYRKSKTLDIYLETDTMKNFKKISNYIRSINPQFFESHIMQSPASAQNFLAFNISIILPKGINQEEIIKAIEDMDGVQFIEEI